MPSFFKATNKSTVNSHMSIVRKSGGFTLIELLVVIAIIGVLATFIVASFSSAQTRARDSRRKADIDAMKKALELYKADNVGGYYPAANIITTPTTLTTPGYIRAIPPDPLPSGSYVYTPSNCSAGGCLNYSLRACLENTADPQKDATNTCTAPLVSYTVVDP